jgi:DHA1 family multidrug resistance protein-like MFS transporter
MSPRHHLWGHSDHYHQFNSLGINWAGTLLGCVAALLIPLPVLFYLYGPKIRAKSKFATDYLLAAQAHTDERME